MTDYADFKKKLAGGVGQGVGDETTENAYSDFYVQYTIAADDGMASTATANTKIWTNPFDQVLLVAGAKYNPNGTITADNSNFGTLQIKTDDGAAGTPAISHAGSSTITDWGNAVASVSKTLTLQSTRVTLPVGGNIWYAITKSGTGVVMRAGLITVKIRKVA